MSLAYSVGLIFHFYSLIILIRIFCTWIPNIDWYQQPFRFIREISDVYLNIFRKFIPPIGMIDASPIVAIILLAVIQKLVVTLLYNIGL